MASANQDRLRTHFAALAASPTAQAGGWDTLWQSSTFLPWDRGMPNPALLDLLTSVAAGTAPPVSSAENPTPGAPAVGSGGVVEIPGVKKGKGGKRALVPGCGTGYDVKLLSEWGFDAWGLEVSESAVRAAGQYLKTAGDGEDVGRAECILGDFFAETWVQQTGGTTFDLIYDNTFLCALPPALRPQWAARMSALLAPGGRLVCLEFPTHKPASTGGPPYSLPPGVHLELLQRPGEEIEYDSAGVVVSTERSAGPGALKRVAHYVPARTHDVGVVKGVVRDCVSVWAHA